MRNLTDFIAEGGQYKEFVDEDTGEIVKIWVEDPDPEELSRKLDMAKTENDDFMEKWAKERELRKEFEPYQDQQWELESELKDLQYQLRSLRSDQEEEIGSLYAQGKYEEGDKLAQEYGVKFDKIEKAITKAKKKLAQIAKKLSIYYDKLDKIWGI
jgi:chromosome segregation ATPase